MERKRNIGSKINIGHRGLFYYLKNEYLVWLILNTSIVLQLSIDRKCVPDKINDFIELCLKDFFLFSLFPSFGSIYFMSSFYPF